MSQLQHSENTIHRVYVHAGSDDYSSLAEFLVLKYFFIAIKELCRNLDTVVLNRISCHLVALTRNSLPTYYDNGSCV